MIWLVSSTLKIATSPNAAVVVGAAIVSVARRGSRRLTTPFEWNSPGSAAAAISTQSYRSRGMYGPNGGRRSVANAPCGGERVTNGASPWDHLPHRHRADDDVRFRDPGIIESMALRGSGFSGGCPNVKAGDSIAMARMIRQ